MDSINEVKPLRRVWVTGTGDLLKEELDKLQEKARELGLELLFPERNGSIQLTLDYEDSKKDLIKTLERFARSYSSDDLPVPHSPVDQHELPDPARTPKIQQAAPKFRQFQANQRNHQSQARHRFAQIRPPRRGGR